MLKSDKNNPISKTAQRNSWVTMIDLWGKYHRNPLNYRVLKLIHKSIWYRNRRNLPLPNKQITTIVQLSRDSDTPSTWKNNFYFTRLLQIYPNFRGELNRCITTQKVSPAVGANISKYSIQRKYRLKLEEYFFSVCRAVCHRKYCNISKRKPYNKLHQLQQLKSF